MTCKYLSYNFTKEKKEIQINQRSQCKNSSLIYKLFDLKEAKNLIIQYLVNKNTHRMIMIKAVLNKY